MRNEMFAICPGLIGAALLQFATAAVMACEAPGGNRPAEPCTRSDAEAKGSWIEGGAVLMPSGAGASAKQLRAQYDALLQIEDLRLTYDGRGIPRDLYGRTPIEIPRDIRSAQGRASLEAALAQLRPMLLAEGTETVTLAREPQVQMHLRSIPFNQSIRGVPVRDGHLVMTVDDRIGKVVMISAVFLPDRGLPRSPKIAASEAIDAAIGWMRTKHDAEVRACEVKKPDDGLHPPHDSAACTTEDSAVRGNPSLGYRIGNIETADVPARLVWVVEVASASGPLAIVEIDAIDATLVGVANRGIVN